MMLLTLMGGVKFNVLNAQQETKTIGSGDGTHGRVPTNVCAEYSYNQQIYTKDELNIEADVIITNISLRIAGANNVTRKWKVYMLNLEDKSSFSNATDWVSVTESDVFYNGDVSISGENGAWIDINSEGGFVYSGNNLLLCIQDYTGAALGEFIYFYTYNSDDNSCIRKTHWSELTPGNIVDAGNATYDGVMNQIKFTWTSSAPAVRPSSVPEITSIEATHNSVTLSWGEVENAKKYNVYTSTGDFVKTVNTTSCTIEGLEDLTEYCYQVSAVNGEFETDKSAARCATTLKAPVTQKLIFTLNDSYGDGWTNCKLVVEATDGTNETLTVSNGKSAATYEIEIAEGATVTIKFTVGTYPEDCSYILKYDDDVVVIEQNTLTSGYSYTFVVRSSAPKVTIAASAYDIYSDQTATLTATAANFDGDVEYSWSSNEGIVGTGATYTFDPSAEGIYTFTCTATDANNEASESVTINVTRRPALALELTADKTEIYQGQNTMLDANATGGFPPYTYEWFLNGEEYGTGESFYFDQTEVDEYTITCKVTDDNDGTIEDSVTVSVLANPFAGRQFRLKVEEGSSAGYYLDVYNDNGTIGVESKTERNTQIFTIEIAGNQQYYLKTADGYYIKCETGNNWWNVHAYNTYDKTPLVFEYTDGEQFYIKDYDKMTGNSQTGNNNPNNCYFKVENAKVYCDAPIDKYESESHRTVLWSLEEVLPSPENLAIVEGEKTQLYPGETTEISWNALDGAASYNVYVNGDKFNTDVEGSPYVLVNLPYGMNTIAVAAVFENGSESGMSNTVTVQVAGTFNLVLNVKDNESKPIADAMVTITGYDEFDVQKNYEFTTDENGVVNKTLLLPLIGTQFSIEVSKAPYEKGYSDVANNDWSGYVENGSTVTREVTLQLPGVNQIDTDKEYYDENEPITLMWGPVENATYNVYVNKEETPKNAAPLTTTTYTLEDGLQYNEYGNQVYVTAVYTIGESDGESDKGDGTQVKVNGYGTVSGTVTYGTNYIKGANIVITGQDEYNQERTFTFTTAEDGTFEGSVVFGYDYTATVSKYGYEEVTIENVEVTSASNAYDFGTITLSKVEAQEATINNLVAEINNDNVVVSWEAEYSRYNVYRKDAAENYEQLGDTTANTYTDESWATLENGEYTYGVSALSETTNIVTETFEGYEVPEGWYVPSGSNWYNNNGNMYSSYGNNGNIYYLVTPKISTRAENATLSFDYYCMKYNNIMMDELRVYYSTSQDGPWVNEIEDVELSGEWATKNISLTNIEEDEIYVAFANATINANGVYLDNVTFPSVVSSESSIVWASPLTKNDANVFTSTGEWTFATNWSNGVPADGANVFIKGNVTIASDVTVNNMTINGGSVTINNGASLTVNGTLVNSAAENLVINDGAQIFQSNEDVPATFVMGINKPEEWQSDNKTGWQFISSPFTNALVFNFTNASEGNYDLFKYDGDEDLEWRNHKANAVSFGKTFEQGVGYLASHETESTIELTGTLNAENYHSWNDFYYDYEKPLSNFHLLGNPFTFKMDMTQATFTNLVEGVAIVNNEGGYSYDVDTIPVGDGFFVQAIPAIGTDPASLSYGGRAAKSEKSNSLNITATGNAGKDNVVINFAGKSEGFNKLQNFNDAIATVYVAEDGKNYGIYNCDADVQEVELNFNANKMGNYTISIEPNGEFETVTLVDRFTGVETNMLEGEYTFTAMSSDNHNRFIVRFANGQQTTDNSHFVYQSGEELILNIQGDVQIVDVLGRVVYNGKAMNDINRINVSSFNSGAYMVRVVNGNDVKVEKVVIY